MTVGCSHPAGEFHVKLHEPSGEDSTKMTELESPPAGVVCVGARPSQTRLEWWWIAVLISLTALFFFSFFNRFAGLRSGDGEFTTGMALLHGRLPYRDYFSATPPLNTLKSALLLRLFGPFLIVNRTAGVAERLLIAVLLFKWLCRLFPARFAFTASLVTIIVSAGDIVDPVASYNHDAILWAILSGFAASHVLDERRGARLMVWSALAGLCAGLCLVTKQTVGFGAVVGVPVVMAILLSNCKRIAQVWIWLSLFVAGCAVPSLALGVWLHHLHLLRVFLDMAFLKGPAAKGGHPGAFLAREMIVAQSNWFFVLLALLAVTFTWRAVLRSQRTNAGHEKDRSAALTSMDIRRFGVGFGAVIASAELLQFVGIGTIHNLSKSVVYLVLILAGVLFVAYAVACTRAVLSRKQQQFALFAAVSLFIAFFLSLSWPAFEAMSLPGFGLVAAATMEGLQPPKRKYVYLVLAGLIFFQVREKLDAPFAFDGLVEAPVRNATEPSKLPALRGLRLSAEMNRFLEATVGTIKRHSGSTDTILTYPEMGLLYELSDRSFPTLSGSHNVDVVNDTFAAEEASRILERKPAVVIFLKLSRQEVVHEDEVWRFGKPSGQHLLVSAVKQLTQGYNIAETFQVGKEGRTIMVFTRRPQ